MADLRRRPFVIFLSIFISLAFVLAVKSTYTRHVVESMTFVVPEPKQDKHEEEKVEDQKLPVPERLFHAPKCTIDLEARRKLVPGVGSQTDGFDYVQDANNLAMGTHQCRKSFPNLYDEISRSVRKRNGRKITAAELDEPNIDGQVRGMVLNGRIYVFKRTGVFRYRELSIFESMNRAILSSPEPIPNFHFTFNTHDEMPAHFTSWALARRLELPMDTPEDNTWLMPDFGFWSWPEPKVGSYSETLVKARQVNQCFNNRLEGKISRAVWRGAVLNKVREDLISVSREKPWSDVVALEWNNQTALHMNLLTMSEHCNFKYLLHTEGNSYSGRLKYLQACHSVTFIHKLKWKQHTEQMLVPDGEQQNYVQCNYDWSDLEEKILDLEKNPQKAERIAANAKKLFDRYLSPAAETCYWRRLMRSWSEMMDETLQYYELDEDGKQGLIPRGTPWESYSILREVDWEAF